jgi:hypothetical protein
MIFRIYLFSSQLLKRNYFKKWYVYGQLDCILIRNILIIQSSLTKKKLFPRIMIVSGLVFEFDILTSSNLARLNLFTWLKNSSESDEKILTPFG